MIERAFAHPRTARIGVIAARALTEDARGRVIAVFERSVYVSLREQCICIGPEGLGDGPLNVICENAAVAAALCNLSVGVAAHVYNGALLLGPSIAIALGDAPIWQPPPPSAWSTETLNKGLAALDAALPTDLPREGLALLLRPHDANALPPVTSAAAPAARHLASAVCDRTEKCGDRLRIRNGAASVPSPREAVGRVGEHRISDANRGGGICGSRKIAPHPRPLPATRFARGGRGAETPVGDAGSADASAPDQTTVVDVTALTSLLGLGPGLTPSGDDFFGGALIALNLLGLARLRDALWRGLQPAVATATTEISQAHLAAAAEGFGSAALHALLDDVMTDRAETIAARLAAVAALGHTSGWDALAGGVTVLKASTKRAAESLAETASAR